MNKVPVWKSLGSAYRFAFGDLATIIGLTWLPTIALCAASYFTLSHYFDGVLTAIANGNRYAIYSGASFYYLYRLGALFLESVIAVSVMRQALAPREKAVFVHFALGLSELRLFASFVAAFLVLFTVEIVAAIALVVLALILAAVAGSLGPVDGVPAQTVALWVDLVIGLVFIAMIVLASVRLTFFLVPVAVAENKVDLVRAWELSRGNFWRAFWIMLFTGVPVLLLYMAIQFAFVGFAVATDAPDTSPFAITLSSSWKAAALHAHAVLAWLPYFYGAWFLIRPLSLGLNLGAVAAAYRALVPDAPAVSTPSAAVSLRTAIS